MTYRPTPPPTTVRLPVHPQDSSPAETVARLRGLGPYGLRGTSSGSERSAIEREADRVRETYF